MKERDIIIKKLRDEVVEKLADVSRNSRYPDLLKYLIVQGLMTIAENKVILQCRSEDISVVKAQIPAAIKFYQEYIQQQTNIAVKCQIDISNEYLPPAPSSTRKGLSCCGGIVLSARNGSIVCRNTLDSRLDLCFDNLIPQVRGILFGVRDKPVEKAEQKQQHHQ